MSRRDDSSGELEDVRREIDDIDDGILDLLKQRFRAVERVKQIKGFDRGTVGSALRPAREAQVIRRLVAASRGDVPVRLVAKMWFELMAAATRLQSPISIHLPRSPVRLQLQDLVRFHAGAELRVVEHGTPQEALTAVGDSQGDIMFCPLGEETEAVGEIERQCFVALLGAGPEMRIAARLPFVAGTGDIEVLVAGKVPYEPSGDDTTLLAVKSELPVTELLIGVGFDPAPAPKPCSSGADMDHWRVYEMAGFVSADDDRLAALSADPRCSEIRYLGGFANPIEKGDAT